MKEDTSVLLGVIGLFTGVNSSVTEYIQEQRRDVKSIVLSHNCFINYFIETVFEV